MAYSELMLDVHDSVATLTFNRPEAMNALGGALRDEFADAVEVLAERAGKDVSAVVLTGAGRAFCAGGDIRVLQEMSAKGPDAMRARMRTAAAAAATASPCTRPHVRECAPDAHGARRHR